MAEEPEEITNIEEEIDTAAPSQEELQQYGDNAIRTLEYPENVRRRPGMYIGKLGDGSYSDDGIYVLLKEVIDNSIDEYMAGFGKKIIVDVTETTVTVRDFGRGIPLNSVVDASSKLHTGGKFDTKVFKRSVGLNGVGIKAVNALSSDFLIQSVRDGEMKRVQYCAGIIATEEPIVPTEEPGGTMVQFTPDNTIFRDYRFREEFVIPLIKNYTFLNTGLVIIFNGKRYSSKNGLLDLLAENMTNEPLYPPILLKGEDIEVAITHANQYGEEYYSFVNSQFTTQGGTHLSAFKEAVSRTVKEYIGKSNIEFSDVRSGMVAAVSIKVEEPVFESQTKIRLGSRDMGPDGPTIAKFIGDFIKKELDDYLYKNLDVAEAIKKKVESNEKERKAMAGLTKKVREQNKKISLNNKKLLDCRVHLTDSKGDEEKKLASSIFITEGDSAAGSITKIRNVETQAVFSLRGKPKNTYGKTKKMVYENEEFNLLQAALNIEESLDNLRYNKVIIATDADVDGMHIRMLLLCFFLQFFPDLVKKGHVYILQTPLFRVRNKKNSKRGASKKKGAEEEVYYCYSDQERITAIDRLGTNAEITRFKGLGEISPEEFRGFIGPDIRLDRVALHKEDGVSELLRFYMGKNTIERQNFIIENLVIEDDSEIS
ncbi:MAG: type IIA DNA topoisomerase subunit B [Bacteroidales bacterium]|nr:type IIA DNA topoisomerase subunit B [Bacteroidales bacterium]